MYLIYMLMCWRNDKSKSLFSSLYTFIFTRMRKWEVIAWPLCCYYIS